MSKPAWEHLTTHLPEIRQAVLPNTGSKIGEPGLALLLYLSGQTNKQGEFFMTAKTMQEETGIATLRQVEKLLAGFVALGWITPTGETNRYMERGRPTPVYVLTLFPQYAQLFARTLHKSEEIPSGETVEKSSNANTEKAFLKNNETESEPEPEPDPQAGHGAGIRGEEYHQILADCLACEPTEGDNGRLVPWLIKQYDPIILQALKDRPSPDLVAWCVDTRRGIQHRKAKAPSPASHAPDPLRPWHHASPDCPICNGQGTGNYWSDQEQRRVSWLCKCCPGGSYEGDETSTPSPASHADIDRVKAELKHLRIVG